MKIPTLETERLILRPLTIDDADEVFQWTSDERVTKYLIYVTHKDLNVTKAWIESLSDNENEYVWGFELKETGLLIGSGSIRFRPDEDCWSFGYNIRYDCWNKGYTTEAAKRMIEFAKTEYGARSFRSIHAVDNPASGRVMEKCGLHFSEYGEFSRLDGSETFKAKIYRMTVDE